MSLKKMIQEKRRHFFNIKCRSLLPGLRQDNDLNIFLAYQRIEIPRAITLRSLSSVRIERALSMKDRHRGNMGAKVMPDCCFLK